jgi:uncharacterized peroxidase-related enzyme
LKVTPSNTKVSEYVLVLARDPETLAQRTPLFNEIMYGKDGLGRAERELAALGASIANHCIFCVAVHSGRYLLLTKRQEVIDEIFAAQTGAKLDPRIQSIFDFAVELSPHPPRPSKATLGRMRDAGLADLEILDVILCSAMFAWANRLMDTLGEPLVAKPEAA